MGWIRWLVGGIGASIIYALIWIFGRTRRWRDVPWLAGPVGSRVVGDAPYQEAAAAEGLTIERNAEDGGLIPDMAALGGNGFEPSRLHPLVREFYKHTATFGMDVWSQTFFPTNVALWLLVTTISRQVRQLNFPLSPLDTARGLSSEIILLRRADGSLRYTGWFRQLTQGEHVLYTGFYMTEQTPGEARPSVKVVFPMPRGNATVVLRPEVGADGSLTLDSSGRRFGDAGFYRLSARSDDRVRVWRIQSLKEFFHVYVDDLGTLRCDHTVRFLALPVLRLHYKMFRLP